MLLFQLPVIVSALPTDSKFVGFLMVLTEPEPSCQLRILNSYSDKSTILINTTSC